MNTPRFQTIDANRFAVGQLAMFNDERFVPFVPAAITGEETILAVGAAKEVTVSHETEASFLWSEYPTITAVPSGVRVQVLAARSNGDTTNGARFVLLVEDLEFNGYNGRDITFSWSRKGGV